MFFTNFKKIGCSFAENKFLEKSEMTAKVTKMLWNDCYEK